jgi:hypothetical protein
MGRKSKASLARLSNICKAPQNPWRATVEDAPDSDAEDLDFGPGIELGSIDFGMGMESDEAANETDGNNKFEGTPGIFFALEDDFDSDSDLDSVSDSDFEEMSLNDDDEAEIRDDAALLTFSAVLQSAQEVAAAVEQKKNDKRKRLKQYTGNSSRTLRQHAMKRRKIASEGQKFISNWFHVKEQGTSQYDLGIGSSQTSEEPHPIPVPVSKNLAHQKSSTIIY